jgi:hypothetical protein
LLLCGDTKISKLYESFLGGQYVGTLDIAVDDALIVEKQQTLQDLGDV